MKFYPTFDAVADLVTMNMGKDLRSDFTNAVEELLYKALDRTLTQENAKGENFPVSCTGFMVKGKVVLKAMGIVADRMTPEFREHLADNFRFLRDHVDLASVMVIMDTPWKLDVDLALD